MDGLPLDTVFTTNVKRILRDWDYPILLLRSGREPHSIFDTPDRHVLGQDTNPLLEISHIDCYFDRDTMMLPLCKSGRNKSKEILLGRHTSNDVCVADATVSKFHGWFVSPKTSSSPWVYVDNSSTNGSSINRHRLSPQQPVAIKYGDEISLGSLYILFLSKDNIFDLMEYMQNESNREKVGGGVSG